MGRIRSIRIAFVLIPVTVAAGLSQEIRIRPETAELQKHAVAPVAVAKVRATEGAPLPAGPAHRPAVSLATRRSRNAQ
jgi:hypothetical protein